MAGPTTNSNAVAAIHQQSPLERELGKRVWWYLVWLDWSHSLSHGGCYAIHPAHNKTMLPANVYDEELERQGHSAAHPLEQYTPMSFSIWRSRFLMVYRESIDMHNSATGMTYPQLLEMDKRLMDLLNGLPAYYQLSSENSSNWQYGDSCQDMELLSIQITAHNRLLRLHRPFLARGLMEKNNISRKRCVDCAYKILALMRHAKDHAPILVRQWLHIYYTFASALVLFLDLCYDEGGESQAAKKKRQAIRELLEVCNTARHLSSAAKNTYNLLQGLLQAETDLRVHQNQEYKASNGASGGGGSKRKRGSNADGRGTASPFASLVERVLVDAAAKNSGPESSTSSIGRSPSEYSGPSGGMFEPPMKRHSTSFVRDRAHSQASASAPFDRLGRNSPMASGGGGHGGYYQSSAENGATPYSYQGNGSSTFPGLAPTSPWGTSSLRGTANVGHGAAGSTLAQTPNAFQSPSAGGFGASFGSPSSMGTRGNGTGANGSHHHNASVSSVPGQTSQQTLTSGMPAATTNGLTSLLDEDIFSGVFSNQQIYENNTDWENMLASVALLPQPMSTPQHHQQ